MPSRCAVIALSLALLSRDDVPASLSAASSSGLQTGSQKSPSGHLRVDGTRFVGPDGKRFEWRGITAFRLLDYEADRRSAEAERFLSWASGQRLTVVRVLAMGDGFLELQPADGRRALPALLDRAARHGIYVEVVAFAGTATIPVDLETHVAEIGRILAAHSNGLLEIANEPVHPTQRAEVQNADVLKALASKVPDLVPVSLGSIERGDGFGLGDYVTWHAPRDDEFDGWGHVLAIPEGAALIARWKKPIISDEPIGAGDKPEPGRRDDSPARFRAAAALTRLVGLGATFHYEGGLQTIVPDGRQLACFAAWREGLDLMQTLPDGGRFFASDDGSPASVSGARAAFGREFEGEAWVLAIDPGPKVSVTWRDGWREQSRSDGSGVMLVRARR